MRLTKLPSFFVGAICYEGLIKVRDTEKAGMECRKNRGAMIRPLVVALAALLLAGCSVKRTAVNIVGNALSGSGGVYTSDDDPELIREALPFGLKTFESLLEVSPKHKGLLLAAASGFSAYAYVLQDEAERLDAIDLSRARTLCDRARKHYLRSRNYALRGLELEHPHFRVLLKKDRVSALALTIKKDVPFLYWAGASWAGALNAAKDDLGLIGDLPLAGALVRRVVQLDETYEYGAAHEFLISYEGSRPGGSNLQARKHYRRAIEISGGQRASAHLALAQSVTIREQNISEFKALTTAALAVDPDKVPQLRLVNTIARRRACWMLKHIPDFFTDSEQSEVTK
jgi:predicted anti-sigma-YlaC factor YlaD